MKIVRTPDERFANLPDFPYEPHYVDVLDMRMHYVDEGAGDEVVLCLHGEPSWSFLYRKIIKVLAPHYRVVAPDLIGFGRSDKPIELEDYTYEMHHDSIVAFIKALDLKHITLVCQDWGGLLGLPIATEYPDRFARLVIMNTGLPTGEQKVTEGFKQWLAFAERVGRALPISLLFQRSAVAELSPEVLAAYEAPFPDESYKAGAAQFPLIVPVTPDAPAAEAMRQTRQRLEKWEKPTLVMFSDSDPVTAGGDRYFRKNIPGAQEQPNIVIEGAGHFLQEEKGEEIGTHIHEFIQRS